MKISGWLTGTAIMMLVSLAPSLASAQVDPNKLPKVSCSSLIFSQDFIQKYPKAGAACQEARVYKGKRYAKFTGKVYLTDPTYIVVQVFNVAGDPLDTVTFRPQPSSTLLVNGQPEKFSELKVGDPVTFWISEKRFAMYSAPGAVTASSQGLPPH